MAEERTLSALKPKKETKFIEKLTGKMLRPQTVQEADKSRFIVCHLPLASIMVYSC